MAETLTYFLHTLCDIVQMYRGKDGHFESSVVESRPETITSKKVDLKSKQG